MRVAEFYTWRATYADGTEITEGESLVGAISVSLVPVDGLLLPRHDLAGQEFVRRFGRGFIRPFNGGEWEYLHCIVMQQYRFYVRSSNGSVIITPPDYELYL